MAEDETSTPETAGRRRGRRPEDAVARRVRVIQALADLESARVPFSMADLAERAGMSRATLYRDAGLRDLVGTRGDSPAARPVDHRAHSNLQNRAQTQATDIRALRRALRDAEKRLREAEARADGAELRAVEAERARRSERLTGSAAERIKTESYAEGFAAGARASRRGGGPKGQADPNLLAAAARLPRPALVAARRALARALHPDLFAKDPAASLLATELLKQINAIVGPGD